MLALHVHRLQAPVEARRSHITEISPLLILPADACSPDQVNQVKRIPPVHIQGRRHPVVPQPGIQSHIQLIHLLPRQVTVFQVLQINGILPALHIRTEGHLAVEHTDRINGLRIHLRYQSIAGTQCQSVAYLACPTEKLFLAEVPSSTDVPGRQPPYPVTRSRKIRALIVAYQVQHIPVPVTIRQRTGKDNPSVIRMLKAEILLSLTNRLSENIRTGRNTVGFVESNAIPLELVDIIVRHLHLGKGKYLQMMLTEAVSVITGKTCHIALQRTGSLIVYASHRKSHPRRPAHGVPVQINIVPAEHPVSIRPMRTDYVRPLSDVMHQVCHSMPGIQQSRNVQFTHRIPVSLQKETEFVHLDLHTVLLIFLHDVERRPVVAVIFICSLLIIRSQCPWRIQSIEERIDVKVTLVSPRLQVPDSRESPRSILVPEARLHPDHCFYFFRKIQAVLQVQSCPPGTVDHRLSRIVIITQGSIRRTFLTAVCQRQRVILRQRIRIDPVEPVGIVPGCPVQETLLFRLGIRKSETGPVEIRNALIPLCEYPAPAGIECLVHGKISLVLHFPVHLHGLPGVHHVKLPVTGFESFRERQVVRKAQSLSSFSRLCRHNNHPVHSSGPVERSG